MSGLGGDRHDEEISAVQWKDGLTFEALHQRNLKHFQCLISQEDPISFLSVKYCRKVNTFLTSFAVFAVFTKALVCLSN